MDNYKEYLDPKDGYALVKQSVNMPRNPDWIEIPDGATTAIYYPIMERVYFWKGEDIHWDTDEWMDCKKAELTTVSEFLEVNQSNIVWQRPTEGPALISGADIPSLIKKGESVQFRSAFNVQGGGEWKDLNIERDEEEFSLGDLINTRFEWRLKPQTIKVELELPKPFEPKVGDEVFYINDTNRSGYCVDEHQAHYNYNFGVWRTEEEIKQVVEQLRKIRGTNS
jgi:hypothetical protein